MADKKTNIETVPYNFNELYQNVDGMFSERGYDTTETSNVSQLITSMTYLVSMLNANTSVNVNETILSEAKERDNVFKDARNFGYEPQHITSYRYSISVILEVGSHIIPKYAEFQIGGKKYFYFGNQLEFTNITKPTRITFDIVEGEMQYYTNNESLSVTTIDITAPSGELEPQHFVDVPFTDVEHSGVDVYLTYFDQNGRYVQREEWLASKNYVIDDTVVLDKEFVRVDDIEFRTPRIYFKFGGSGSGIRAGSTVDMNILISTGTEGEISYENINSPQTLQFMFPLAGECDEITLRSVGLAEESISSVKLNAPKFHNSANRCVTSSDYKSFCDRQTTVYKSLVWGGDDEYPKVPGHVWFTFAPEIYERKFTYSEYGNPKYFTFKLDNSDALFWDYSLDSEDDNDKDAYELQQNAQENFYKVRYIQDDEIRSGALNDNGLLIDSGVWDVIDNYKIPTLDFHNRNPIYCYFEFDISILKYSISDSKEAIHQEIFDKIDDFFTGYDDGNITNEDFCTGYYSSTLDQRIFEVLGEFKGYDIKQSTKLLLNERTVATETSNEELKDIYIPLNIPYENYFDSEGYLLTDVLPNIDTDNFINYSNTGEVGNIRTDWSETKARIESGFTQNEDDLISANVVCDMKVEHTFTQDEVDEDYNNGALVYTMENIFIQCDDLRELEEVVPNPTYLNTIFKINGVTIPNSLSVGWYVDHLVGNKFVLRDITFVAGDVLTIEQPQVCGTYYLFNGFRKEIKIHLYVTGFQYTEGGTLPPTTYTSPKSYFYTSDGNYINTTDTYYVTSDGYVTGSTSTIDDSKIVSVVSRLNYKFSPLTMNLFRQNRFLNLNYENDSFSVIGNVMPRLKSVNFEKRV